MQMPLAGRSVVTLRQVQSHWHRIAKIPLLQCCKTSRLGVKLPALSLPGKPYHVSGTIGTEHAWW